MKTRKEHFARSLGKIRFWDLWRENPAWTRLGMAVAGTTNVLAGDPAPVVRLDRPAWATHDKNPWSRLFGSTVCAEKYGKSEESIQCFCLSGRRLEIQHEVFAPCGVPSVYLLRFCVYFLRFEPILPVVAVNFV